MIKLLAKIPYFERMIFDYAFKKRYVDQDTRAKLNEWFILPDGTKYYRYQKDEWLPVTRYEQMQIRLQELESRIGREDLKGWLQLAKSTVDNKKISDLGKLIGALEDRVNLLYDPVLMLRFICGIAIREDQINTAHLWNEEIEEEKFNEIYVQVKAGGLSDFFQKLHLIDIVNFSDLSITGLEIYNQELNNNQTKEVQAFQRMLKKLTLELKS